VKNNNRDMEKKWGVRKKMGNRRHYRVNDTNWTLEKNSVF